MTDDSDNIKKILGTTEENNNFNFKKLLSIHLQSNNPENFLGFINSLENNIQDIGLIEVIVKIDDDDEEMNALLLNLSKQSKLDIKYVSTPLLGNFADLWRSMNDLLLLCEKDTYFLWNMNDEMRIPIKGWDQTLLKYVGIFPDHLFRLRTSCYRSRNYADEWECGFAPETSAITTKKWIDICGDWNPTLGPDTFNQLVAYYFSYHDRFNKDKEIRDIVINDFIFEGEGASVGLNKNQQIKRLSETIKPWFRLFSYKMLLEASRRSQKIKANIYLEKNFINNPGYRTLYIKDKYKKIQIMHGERKIPLVKFPYKISRFDIMLRNFNRSFKYFIYAGGGFDFRVIPKLKTYIRSYVFYILLKLKYIKIINCGRYLGIKYYYFVKRKNVKKVLRALKFIPISIDIILKIPENTYELFVVFFKKNFPDTWIFLKVKYDELTRERKIIDTDTTNFFNQLNFRKINKFLKLNNIKFKLKISIMYVKIVMMCKFYNININEIMKHRQLITSQIANTEFIFNDIYLHENNIEVIDKCLKDKLNYNLRPYVKKSIIDIIFIIYTTISKFTGSIFNPKK
ncbi:MAG: hypothetical protein HN613_06125 [Gammaproteobacteria bacterium]|jgi:hypothetical protein|nr:hypothetical protein [Gammaproteobacteria bacterium]MBT7604029.1 hypothetical protein [Gammaproteobacteria bacterium]